MCAVCLENCRELLLCACSYGHAEDGLGFRAVRAVSSGRTIELCDWELHGKEELDQLL